MRKSTHGRRPSGTHGSSLARPNSATAWETGEDAPRNRSRKRRLPVGTGEDSISDASPTAVQETEGAEKTQSHRGEPEHRPQTA